MNYQKLMEQNPFSYGRIVNDLKQIIELYEHPTQGDYAEVICVCHELELAANSGFYDTEDMFADHKEYEPSFFEGKLYIGGFLND